MIYHDKLLFAEKGEYDPFRQQEKPVQAPKAESPYNVNNILWLLASVAVIYLTDFPMVVFYDPRVHRYVFL